MVGLGLVLRLGLELELGLGLELGVELGEASLINGMQLSTWIRCESDGNVHGKDGADTGRL